MKTTIKTKKNYFISVLAAAVNDGFEPEMDETLEDVVMKAEEYLLENEPYGHVFEQVDFSGHDMSQNYAWADEETDYSTQVSGEIFTFGHNKAEDEVYFRHDWEKDEFVAVNWYDIPNEFEREERKKYVFVFDKQVRSDGKIAWLYDCMG